MIRNLLLGSLLVFPLIANASESDLTWYEVPPELRLSVGSQIPSASLSDLDGTHWETASFRGEPTVVAFFSAYCGPCMKEIPSLNQFKSENPQIRVVVISPDDLDTANRVRAHHGLSWPILSGAEDLLNGWGVLSFPSFLLIDGHGTIVSAPYGNRLTGTHELGYVTAAGISEWVKRALPET